MKRLCLTFLTFWTYVLCTLAQTQIAGYVRDSLSREPIARATITLIGCENVVVSNERGGFNIDTKQSVPAVQVSAIGYQTKVISLKQYQAVLLVDLMRQTVALDEVVVERTRQKYSKKDNPAVELARRLMALKNQGFPTNHPYYSHERYERIMYGLNNYDQLKENSGFFKKNEFLAEYADTSAITGKLVLPVSVKEQFSHDYYRHSPKSHKRVIIGQSSAGIDESLDQQSSIKTLLNEWFQEVDVFHNDITFLTHHFVSPLSAIAPDFYRFYLTDTLDIDGERCVELSFTPRVSETFGFLGRFYVVENDSTLFIKRLMLNVPHNINLNYVERVHIEQDFLHHADGTRLKIKDNMEVEFNVLNAPGMFARRESSYSSFSFDSPEDFSVFDNKTEKLFKDHSDANADELWQTNRPVSTGTDDGRMRQMLARLRQSKSFYWGEKFLVALIKGYIPTAEKSKWDFGPINTIISGNSLEGARFRIGGMSTVNLSRHWFMRAYLAYGTRDKKLKYSAQLEYSFNEKKELDQEFPIHSIRLRHDYDVDRLGQHYLYTNSDNVFLALKRQKDDKMIYRRTTQLEWRLETPSHFSVGIRLMHLVREASRFMPFMLPDSSTLNHYQQAGFEVTLRYAPGEKFYQTRSNRIPISMDAPIITITHDYMPKGFMGSRFEINKTELGVQKRFWFSAFGYTDVIVKGGKIWSKVPYPDLYFPNANLSYTIQRESFALMDAMEFANDQYLTWDLTYWANGVLLNRIPLIKKLKLREVLSLRGFWGSISKKNIPGGDDELFLFPSHARCLVMDKKPYMEIGVGLDNIFSCLRLDYVWRLTYRDTPGVDKRGLRVALHLTF